MIKNKRKKSNYAGYEKPKRLTFISQRVYKTIANKILHFHLII